MVDTPPGSVAYIPEFDVSDFRRDLLFHVDLIGFVVRNDRAERSFALLGFGGAPVIFEAGSKLEAAPSENPGWRGIDLQIEVDDLTTVLKRLERASWSLLAPVEARWYRWSDGYLRQ